LRHRIALLNGSLAAAGTLSVAVLTSGGAPAATPVAMDGASEPAPSPITQVDTVYIAPPLAPQTITIRRTIRAGGEHEHESEQGGDG